MMRRANYFWLPLLVAFALLLATAAACGSARRGQPLVDEPVAPVPEAVQRGHALYDRFCNSCHPGGAGGLGPAINNKRLPGPAMRLQVRSGVGAMPAFGEEVISEQELDAIMEYLDWIEERKPVLPDDPVSADGADE